MAKQTAKEDSIVYQGHEKSLFIPPKEIEDKLNAINTMAAIIQKKLIKDHDFGIIPGTQKPTLLKPGAEKMTKILGLADMYEVTEKTLDWTKPFFYFEIKCSLISLISGQLISEGLGSCNSMEDRYRWRWVFLNELPQKYLGEDGKAKKEVEFRERFSEKTKKWYTQYKVENDNIYTLVNTLMKIAEKRALVDAALHAGRLSDLFTQDNEDIYETYQEEKSREEVEEKEEKPKAETKPKELPKKAETKKEEKKEEKEPEPETEEEEETREAPAQEDAVTEEQAKEFYKIFGTLVDTYKRDPSDLAEKIQDKLKASFGTKRKKIPDDLTYLEAEKIIKCLTLSMDEAKKREAEKQKEDEVKAI